MKLQMNRFPTILLAWALLSSPDNESPGQETTASDRFVAEITPLSGEILLLRTPGKKAEKVTQVSKVTAQDRVGTAGGGPGRISIDAGCMVTLKGVTATEGEGLSIDRVGKTLTVRLHHGRVLVETFAVDLALETPHGRIEGKSVYFLAEVGRESTRIVAIDGELKVSNDLGKMDLGSGETVVFRKGSEPAKGLPADPDKDLAGALAVEEPFNLIKNPGFELDLKDWGSPRYAGKPLAGIDDTMIHGGRKSVRLQLPNISLAPPAVLPDASGNGNAALYTLLDGRVLKPGARYLLRLWIRTENYAVDGKSIPFSFLSRGLVLPDQLPGDGASVCTCPPAEKKWTCVRFVFVARPRSDRDSCAMNFPDGAADRGAFSGTVWLDDFFLAPIPSRPEDRALTGLALWLRGDAGVVLNGTSVVQWSDQSGSNRHATPASPAGRPALVPNGINGKPALQFDGAAGGLGFTLPVNGSPEMTIFLVSSCAKDSDGGGWNAALSWNETVEWGSVFVNPGPSRIGFRFGTGQIQNSPGFARPTPAGAAASVVVLRKEGTTDSLYLNGSLALTQAGRLPAIGGCVDKATLGRGWNDSGYTGMIAELLVYLRALPNAERQAIEQYLMKKYLVTGR
jgi:hypothetical protein